MHIEKRIKIDLNPFEKELKAELEQIKVSVKLY